MERKKISDIIEDIESSLGDLHYWREPYMTEAIVECLTAGLPAIVDKYGDSSHEAQAVRDHIIQLT